MKKQPIIVVAVAVLAVVMIIGKVVWYLIFQRS